MTFFPFNQTMKTYREYKDNRQQTMKTYRKYKDNRQQTIRYMDFVTLLIRSYL
jgi:hypothetical protein